MRRLVLKGKKTLPVRLAALDLVRGERPKDWSREVKRLHGFVRDKIRYIKDIRGIETIHTPEKILELGQGDCDDKSILLASLLESIGHPTRLVAVGFGSGGFSHVYIESKIGRRWIPLETTEPWPVGKAPKGVISRMVVYN